MPTTSTEHTCALRCPSREEIDADMRVIAARQSVIETDDWLYATWRDLNARFFDGLLEPIRLRWDELPARSEGAVTYGRFSLDEPNPPIIRLRRGLANLGETFVRDVLLHEMMHQHEWQEQRPMEGHHNRASWIDEVNQIAPKLGLQPRARLVYADEVNAESLYAWLAQWPHEEPERQECYKAETPRAIVDLLSWYLKARPAMLDRY